MRKIISYFLFIALILTSICFLVGLYIYLWGSVKCEDDSINKFDISTSSFNNELGGIYNIFVLEKDVNGAVLNKYTIKKEEPIDSFKNFSRLYIDKPNNLYSVYDSKNYKIEKIQISPNHIYTCEIYPRMICVYKYFDLYTNEKSLFYKANGYNK